MTDAGKHCFTAGDLPSERNVIEDGRAESRQGKTDGQHDATQLPKVSIFEELNGSRNVPSAKDAWMVGNAGDALDDASFSQGKGKDESANIPWRPGALTR